MTRRVRKNQHALAASASKVKVRVPAPPADVPIVDESVVAAAETEVRIRHADLSLAVDGVLAEVGGFGHPVTVEDCEQVRDMIRARVAPSVSIDVYHKTTHVFVTLRAGDATTRHKVSVQGA